MRISLSLFSVMMAFTLLQAGEAAAAAPKSVVADQSLAGGTVDLAPDSMLVVRLPSNPATGYRWEVINQAAVRGVLRTVDLSPLGQDMPNYEFDKKPAPGREVTQLLHFVGDRSGDANVMVAYRRPWEAGYSKSMRFTVRSKGKFSGVLPQVTRAAPGARKAIPADQLTAPGLPAHYDWREQGGVTPIRDQGQCGSCWAFGAVAVLESKIKIKDKVERDFAEQYLVSCNMHGFSCAGGWWAHDYHWMTAIPAEPGGGGRFEADFPYQAADVACNPPHTPREQLEGWAYVDDIPDGAVPNVDHRPTVAQIKQKILDYGPVGTDVCSTTWGSYQGGVFTTDCTTPTHIVAITGWDDAEGVFYIKNSWGTTWGEAGYMKLAYNTCLVGHNSTYLLYEKTNPRIRYRRDTFFEGKPNDGSIHNTIEVRIEDSTPSTQFKVASGNMTLGTHFNVANLPAGLTMQVQATSATTATLQITGRTNAHANANDISNLTLSFTDAAFSGNSAAAVEDASYAKLRVNFNDPYKTVYFNVNGTWVNYSAPWQFYWLEGSDYQYSFGLWWYDGVNEPDPNNRNTLKFETYTKPALSLGATPPANLKFLNYGDVIGPASTIWAPGGSYGEQHTLAGPAHNAFKGRIGYVGISFEYNGWRVYGWVRVEVDASGSNGRILDYAWNQDPNATIRAGYTSGDTTLAADFVGTPTSLQPGGSVQFSDQSAGSPTAWSWSFPGGTPSTSTVQNPKVTYNTQGTYNVSLTASNATGSNTATKTGYITVANSVCSYAINPTSASVASSGGTGNVSVTTGTGCSWTATSSVPWITVTSGSSGSGNGTVGYSVEAYSGSTDRTGTVTIAGQTFTVTQAGASSTCTTYTGSLYYAGYYEYQPAGNYYQSLTSGAHTATLTGPAGANFDMELWKTDGSAWSLVASTNGPTANETLSYNGTPGYYYWKIISISGSGDYSFCLSKP